MSVSDTLCIAYGLRGQQDWALHVSEQEFISPQSKRLHVATLDAFPERWLILINWFFLTVHSSWLILPYPLVFDDLDIFCSLVKRLRFCLWVLTPPLCDASSTA